MNIQIKKGVIVGKRAKAAVNPDNGEANEYMEKRQPENQKEGEKRAQGEANRKMIVGKALTKKKVAKAGANEYLTKLEQTQKIGATRAKSNKDYRDGQNKGADVTDNGQVEPSTVKGRGLGQISETAATKASIQAQIDRALEKKKTLRGNVPEIGKIDRRIAKLREQLKTAEASTSSLETAAYRNLSRSEIAAKIKDFTKKLNAAKKRMRVTENGKVAQNRAKAAVAHWQKRIDNAKSAMKKKK